MRLSPPGDSAIRLERNLLIELSDGAALAADLRVPAAPGRYPALVSYYPYRKDDLIGAAWEHANTYLAGAGYASLVVDFRGLGGSSGVAAPAMDASEADDLRELLAWTAAQPWCDGNVGMWGLSYGGITAFRAAAAGSPHLKAIAAILAMDDPYLDWFYPGGCRNMLGTLGIWGPMMLALQLAPPLHQDEGGRWRRVWQERLDSGRPYLLPWLEHPARDDYWVPRSIPIERIGVPTYLIGGWRDLFPEAMTRAYERIPAPRALLMGPWLHTAPDQSPFDRVDHVELMRRFFDRWLRTDTAAAAPDGATLYVQGTGWRHYPEWPAVREEHAYLAGDGGLAWEPPGEERETVYRGDPTVGTCAGLWEPLGTGLGLPLDQGPDDLRSLTFTSAPLPEPLEIVGSPEATLRVALDEGDELRLAVKLCEVTPDGRSALVTSGWLDAAFRDGFGTPLPIPSGEPVTYRIRLWATAYRLAPGSRLRVSVSSSDFPRVWPTRRNPLVRLVAGGPEPSSIALPVATAAGGAVELPEPDPAENRMPALIDAEPQWKVERDHAADAVTVRFGLRLALRTPGRDGTMTLNHESTARVARDRPDAAAVTGETTLELETPSGEHVEVTARSRIVAGTATLSGKVTVDSAVVFERHWEGPSCS